MDQDTGTIYSIYVQRVRCAGMALDGRMSRAEVVSLGDR